MANKGLFAILDAGNISFIDKTTKKPYVHIDYANSFEVATTTDLVYAKAKGVNRVAFSKGSTGTSKIETELASTKLFSLLTGSEVTTGAGTILKREVFLVASSRDFTLSKTPTTVLGVGTVMADGVTEIESFTVESGTTASAGKAIVSTNTIKMFSTDLVAGDTLVVYYLEAETSVDKFIVVAKPQSSYYEVYADVSVKYDSDGSEDFVQLHIFKAKPKENLTLTFSTDNPSKFTIEMDVLPDSAYKYNGADGMYEWSQIS